MSVLALASMALKAIASSRVKSATLDRGPAPPGWGEAAAAAAAPVRAAASSPSFSPREAPRRSRSSRSRTRLVERNICARTKLSFGSCMYTYTHTQCARWSEGTSAVTHIKLEVFDRNILLRRAHTNAWRSEERVGGKCPRATQDNPRREGMEMEQGGGGGIPGI